jgi:hypothetical protein
LTACIKHLTLALMLYVTSNDSISSGVQDDAPDDAPDVSCEIGTGQLVNR